jgi:hypothetical protein
MSFEQGAMSEGEERAMQGDTTRDVRTEEPSIAAVGFIMFAGVILTITGIIWFFEGLSAVLEDEFFIVGRNYSYDLDVSTWGWVHMVGGIILTLSGLFLFTGNVLARMVGVIVAALAIVANFFFIPYYPVWSLVIIAMGIGVIWALTAHGRDIVEE